MKLIISTFIKLPTITLLYSMFMIHSSYCMNSNTKSALSALHNIITIENQNDDPTLLQINYDQVEFGSHSKQYNCFGQLLLLTTPGTMKCFMAKNHKNNLTKITLFDPHAIQLNDIFETKNNTIKLLASHNDRIIIHKRTNSNDNNYDIRIISRNKKPIAYFYYHKNQTS